MQSRIRIPLFKAPHNLASTTTGASLWIARYRKSTLLNHLGAEVGKRAAVDYKGNMDVKEHEREKKRRKRGVDGDLMPH